MNRRLFAGAIVTVVILGATACSGGGQTTAGPTASSSSSSSASATPSASAAPSASATPSDTPVASASSPGSAANPANPPRPTTSRTTISSGSNPASSTPPPNPNAAYCQTFASILLLAFEIIEPSIIITESTDPTEVEQAWQDLQRIAEQGAALARQAVGQTSDPILKAGAEAMATQFDYIAAAAAARDLAALESMPEPDMPELPDGTAPCDFPYP